MLYKILLSTAVNVEVRYVLSVTFPFPTYNRFYYLEHLHRHYQLDITSVRVEVMLVNNWAAVEHH